MKTIELIGEVSAISKRAGVAIMEVYRRDGSINVENKADNSPLTEADLAAHHIIVKELYRLNPDIPILSEESEGISWQQRRDWELYWLVDPLDGTKEFINRNGEFTVNIALIEKGVPILGVVYVPVLEALYYGSIGNGAYKEVSGEVSPIFVNPITPQQSSLKVVASRNHRGEQLDLWLKQVGQIFAEVTLVSMGSSLKICLIAEGKADIYPRLALTSEWDTAAAQAILEAAGGTLTDINHQLYRYNQKEDILNPYFFAIGDKSFDWSMV